VPDGCSIRPVGDQSPNARPFVSQAFKLLGGAFDGGQHAFGRTLSGLYLIRNMSTCHIKMFFEHVSFAPHQIFFSNLLAIL
jgi:hypothetical protein